MRWTAETNSLGGDGVAFFPLVARKQLLGQRDQYITVVAQIVARLELAPGRVDLDDVGVLGARQPRLWSHLRVCLIAR